jgi:hypothetical protein
MEKNSSSKVRFLLACFMVYLCGFCLNDPDIAIKG